MAGKVKILGHVNKEKCLYFQVHPNPL